MLSICALWSCGGPGQPQSAQPPDSASVSPGGPPPEPLPDKYGLLTAGLRVDTLVMPRGVALVNFLRNQGVDRAHLLQLDDALQGGLPPRKFRAGKRAFFFRGPDSTLTYVVYEHSLTEFVAFDLRDSLLRARHDSLRVQHERVVAHARIESSLWNAMEDANARPDLALNLSEIFAWSVDFFGLERGDEFLVSYDRKMVDSVPIASGSIYAAAYIHRGDTLAIYRFMQDSLYAYWDRKGQSVRKAFLKAPLKFSRISSGFSYARRHPILKVVRPHTGVDYAAPMGTPVHALGDGKVIARAYQRGGGNYVKIRHNGVYTTAYLHLSRFAKGIRPGVRVRQGQTIGYVGMTGYATGPHLDFRVWKNGTPINPLSMKSPPMEPLRKENMDAFRDTVRRLDRELGIHAE
ncbi:MAG: metalloendopeptidase [Bacteroidia bacterium]|nr:MAG: metalloendopeptidase [Bacteroidia bacterium]